MLTLLLVAHAATWSSTYPEPVKVPPFDDAGGLSQPPAPHWSVQLPGGVIKAASHTELVRPVILETSILVGSSSGAALYMLDRRNGVLIRSFPAHASVESAPAVVEDRVLFADTGGTVWCYQLDGELLWSFETKAPVLAAPAVADGRVFVSNVDDLVVALSLADGALIWRYQERPDLTRAGELGLYAAPQPVLARGELLVGFSDGALVSLDPADGDVAWLLRVGEGKYPDIVASPASDGDDLVFVSGYFEPTVALDLDSRKVRWTAEFGAAASARVVQDGERRLMVHPGTDGKLRAFDTVTGDPAWTWDSLTDGSLTAPEPTDLGLLVGSTAGTLTLLDPHDGSERWHYEPLRILDGVSSAPAVRGRQIVFVTNAGRLYSMVAPRPERVWAGVSSWDMGNQARRPPEAQRPAAQRRPTRPADGGAPDDAGDAQPVDP